MKVGEGGEIVEMQAALGELVMQDPRCYYTMSEVCVRRYASHGCASELQDTAFYTIVHPSAAMVLNKQQAAGASDAKTSSSKVQAQGQDTSSSTGARAEGGLLNNWKQAQAFLSALLSYRKGMMLLRESAPGFDLQLLDRGLQDALQWFSEEGVLDALKIPGAAEQMSGNKGSRTDAARAGDGEAKGASASSSGDSAEATAADPEEAAACRMLALCVLSRVLITFCQQLTGVGSKGSSSSSPASGEGASVSNKAAVLAEQLKQIDFTEEKTLTRLRLGCSLGLACYCLGKQVQQYGSCISRSDSKGGSSSSSGAASGAANSGGSSISKTGKGSSSNTSKGSSKGRGSKGGGEPSATTVSSSSSSHQKWGGLHLELPPSVLERLQGLEGRVTYDNILGDSAIAQAANSQKVVVQPGRSILLHGKTEGLIELLELLLELCEGIVAAVPVPLGCNNPSCTSLDGVSEASAAKVCSGCKKAHYCGTGCMKAHWKQHKPYCK